MKKVILLASVLIFTLTGIGFAGPRGFGPDTKRGGMFMPRGKWWEIPKISESLTINQEEKEKLETMHYENRMLMIDLRGEVQKARLQLEQLMRGDSFNSEAGIQGFKRLQDARNALASERFKYVVEIREMLGTERYQKLKSAVREYRKKSKGDRRRKNK